MLPSEIPRLATELLVRLFPGVWNLLSFLRLPSQEGYPSLPLLSLFFSFIFCPTSFWRQWAAFLGAWCPLPAFRSCFVEFAQQIAQKYSKFKCSFDEFVGWESGLPIIFLWHLRTAPELFLFWMRHNVILKNTDSRTRLSSSFTSNMAFRKSLNFTFV